ncbi:MAG: hypothetical protein JSV79_03290 [Armatimonadota bacterium]|nr:MAG: hypothetical protein JSV79_03290 [Armatimonadota bacterium]
MTLAAAIVAIVAALVGAVVGGLLGLRAVHTADHLQQAREERQRVEERGHLARSLVAEIRGLLARWDEIKADFEKQSGWTAARWSLEESYFSVFESVGNRLSLLPPDLAERTVSCYVKMKVVLDNLRLATQAAGNRPLVQPILSGKVDAFVRAATERAVKYADDTASFAQELVRELEAVAEGC